MAEKKIIILGLVTISGEKQSVIKELKEKNASTYKAGDDEPSPHDISSKDPEMEALMKERRAVSESRFKLLEKQQVWTLELFFVLLITGTTFLLSCHKECDFT